MHRSGTTLVTKSLEKAGIFMGVLKDHNFEAMHFLSLNQQTLWAVGASWLQPTVPEPVHYKILPARVLYEEHFKLVNRWQKLKHRAFPQAWGWKDPRNTFTLPMWLAVFPGARVLHVLRNEEAVAESLKKRNKIVGEVHDPRLDDRQFNLALTRQYQQRGKSYATQLGTRYHEIHYEDIITLNAEAIKALEKFTGHRLQEAFQHFVKS